MMSASAQHPSATRTLFWWQMTTFIGGPYDGRDLPYDPLSARHIRMPDDGDRVQPGEVGTVDADWPHIYEADLEAEPPVYRFVRTERG